MQNELFIYREESLFPAEELFDFMQCRGKGYFVIYTNSFFRSCISNNHVFFMLVFTKYLLWVSRYLEWSPRLADSFFIPITNCDEFHFK